MVLYEVTLGTLMNVLTLPLPLRWLGPSKPLGQLVHALKCLLVGALSLVAGAGLWRESLVRTWTIDSERIDVRDARGQWKSLRWHEIERVKWWGQGVHLQVTRRASNDPACLLRRTTLGTEAKWYGTRVKCEL